MHQEEAVQACAVRGMRLSEKPDVCNYLPASECKEQPCWAGICNMDVSQRGWTTTKCTGGTIYQCTEDCYVYASPEWGCKNKDTYSGYARCIY